MAEHCFFEWKFKCEDKPERLIESGHDRIQSIIKCSKVYNDGKHQQLEDNLRDNMEYTLTCHKNCASTYTSSTQIKRHLKRGKQEAAPLHTPPKKTRLSSDASFNFQHHCIYCGKACELEKDIKHPTRWRPAYLCREIKSKLGKPVKKLILETCDTRNDGWAASVRGRVEGAVSDLHAADARYHVDCRSMFMSSKAVALAAQSSEASGEEDTALQELIVEVKENLARIWNSVELFREYKEHGGDKLSRRLLVKELSDYFGEDLLVLSSSGIASIIVFRSKASDALRLVDDEDDDLDVAVTKVCKQIKLEVGTIPTDRAHYSTYLNCETAMESVSETILELLANVSPKLDRTLPAILIGSMITSVLHNHPTSLQIDLGVLIQASKGLVNQMHAFGVTCSYDEVLRFKKSAALAATEDIDLSGISQADSALVQVVADNFDADISSQNGKLSTHSLAVLVTQPEPIDQKTDMRQTIKRIKKQDMSVPIEYDLTIQRYNGAKNPGMPKIAALKSVLPLKVLVHKFMARNRADESDFAFLQDIITKPGCPEFNGYNTATSREQGQTLKPKTKAVYLPLIDMTPSDPDTMMTALVRAQQLTHEMGQEFVVFTCDLQLYRVALHVTWAYMDRFPNVIMRLGGMHTLMSFVGSIGTLMAETGLADVLSTVFGGVAKMLTGKKFPQNVRAMRLVVEELLRHCLQTTPAACKRDLMEELESLASKSKTTKLWVDVLIKPVFIMMMFIRAEREGDWPLHLEAFSQMLPYFFAAGHVHYARYGLFYLRAMESLPDNVRDHFMDGQHVMRHVAGIWNGIWSDMFIETTFMRYGHGQGGIIGITLKPETLKTWALSRHICGQLESNLSDMVDVERTNVQTTHKEESTQRITNDSDDRDRLRKKLESCIDPLDPEKHPDEIVNIVTGRIGTPSVNAHKAIAIGISQMQTFESTWPTGFYDTIPRKITTMTVTKKHVSVGGLKVFDIDLIYSRVIGLQASSREVDIADVLAHELAPIPTSMFTESGEMRISKAKSVLKKQLQVEVSARHVTNSVTVIDGSALLWVVHWPAGGTVKDFVNNFKGRIENLLQKGDVYLIFDRYYAYSTKSGTRGARMTEASRVHQLKTHTELPPQKVVLTVTENKQQLMDIICTELIHDEPFHLEHVQEHKLVITGHDTTPVEINSGLVIHRRDMDTTHEEADIIIVQQMLLAAKDNPKGITVLSDDTDVFMLLLHYHLEDELQISVTMESPIKGRVVVDIGKTVEKHRDIIPEILPAHALSGCDTVACCFGIGKGSVLKVVRSGLSLSLLGQHDAPMATVIQQATAFMTACYGQSNCATMSTARLKVWASKTGKGYTSTPKLCSLPPTTEAFVENIKRAHHQACMWRSLKAADPPELDPEQYGWKKDIPNKSLSPVTVPENVPLAPATILRLIRCGCTSDTPCSSSRCGCNNAKLPCTVFCACHGAVCCNTQTA